MLIRREIMPMGVLDRTMGDLNKVMLLNRDTNHNKAIPSKATHSSNVIHCSKVTHSSKVIHSSKVTLHNSQVTLHNNKGILLNNKGILLNIQGILLMAILLQVILLKRLPLREILPISEL